MSTLLVSTKDFVKTLTIDGPSTKNAVTLETEEALLKAVQQSAHDHTRVIVLTGSGGDFCSGASLDPTALLDEDFDITRTLRTTANPLILAMRECPVPILAKVRGVAVGIGFSLALAADLIYASHSARFSMIFSRIGLASDGGGAYFLPRRIGYHKAFELMVTGKLIGASEAEMMGIINKCVPENELDSTVQGVIDHLTAGPFLSFKAIKQNLLAAETGSLAEVLDVEAVQQGTTGRSQDFREGVTAFIEKRKANFTGS